jgi:hypothetical protein
VCSGKALGWVSVKQNRWANRCCVIFKCREMTLRSVVKIVGLCVRSLCFLRVSGVGVECSPSVRLAFFVSLFCFVEKCAVAFLERG